MKLNISNKQAIQHLFLRAGFGATPADINQLENQLPTNWVDSLLQDASLDRPINVVPNILSHENRATFNETMDKKQQHILKRDARNLFASHWIAQMSDGKAKLREKLCFFWHGHFACKAIPFYAEEFINILRTNSLGNFYDLLVAVSQSMGMMRYLNLNSSAKGKPNENFARELLELFTLGEGNYTQTDVKEAARALTGWRFDNKGNFFINQRQWDNGEKTFLGEKGNFTGYDIFKIILKQRNCSLFLAKKLCQFFVSDKPNEAHVRQVANFLYNNNYHIGQTLAFMFNAEWFYSQNYLNAKVKSPVELLIGYNYCFGLQYSDTFRPVILLQNFQQMPTLPPNVAGWPRGNNWISANALLKRINLANYLLGNGAIDISFKKGAVDELNTTPAITLARQLDYAKSSGVRIDWNIWLNSINKWNKNEIKSYFSTLNMPFEPPANFQQLTLEQKKEIIIGLCASIEYQFC